MDSGNSSGSMQSSSGGEEEYDSRADHQIPSFLTSNSSAAATTAAHFGHISAANQNLSSSSLLSLHHNLPTAALFDPSTSYLQGLSNTNSLLNMDLLRSSSSRGGLPTANCTDIGNFSGPSPSMFVHQHQQGQQSILMPNPSSLLHSRSSLISDNGGGGKFPGSPSSDHHHHSGVNQSTTTLGVRNSKKRTRASRRAPTTVLTTDTSNFRAMVQEFTGIPAPPFSSSPYSRRLDLFGSSGLRSGHLEPMASLYPLRPSAQKIQPSSNPFAASDSSTPSLLNTSALLDNAGNFNSSGNNNYLNMQNPILSFQSLLQPPPYQHQHQQQMLPSSSSLQDHQGQAQSSQVNVRSGGGWRGGMGSSSAPPQERINNDGKIFSYTPAPPQDFDHQNTNHPPAPAARPDGTVESWICPSD